MSRIFGARSALAAGPDPEMTSTMARSLTLLPSWSPAVIRSGFAVAGWVGAGPPRAAQADGIGVVLDGNIHNREELGFAASDAEGFIELFHRSGFEGAMRAVNGDLAVALFDASADRLWLGRDRIGVKPLYWASVPGGLAFASQPRGLVSLRDIGRAVDREYVALVAGSHYRTFDNRRDRSPYAAVAQLPAGHVLEAGPSGIGIRTYWDLAEAVGAHGDVDDADLADRYRDLLADAVRLRLGSSSVPAFTLSGGMDSSSVVASAVEVTGARQHAFSSTYHDPTYDEREEIASMLDAAVAEWHPVEVEDPDLLAVVSRMVAVHDEPVATATWLSHWVISGAVAGGGFDVLFGGLGGDELNAGEYEHFAFHHADLRAAGREAELAHEIERWAVHHDHPIWRKNRQVMEDELTRRVDPSRPGGNRPDLARLGRYVDAVRPEWFDLASYEPVMDHPFATHLQNRSYQDLFRETTPCCLRAEDRHGAAFGIDHADPFLDHRVVELLFAVPGDRKIRDGVTKIVLREAMQGVLPEATRTRIKKTGWNAPAHLWFAGESGAAVRELIESPELAARGIYDISEVRRIYGEHQAIVASGEPRENHMMFLWQLVNLELWLRGLDAGGPA